MDRSIGDRNVRLSVAMVMAWKAHEMAVYDISALESNTHAPFHGAELKIAYP